MAGDGEGFNFNLLLEPGVKAICLVSKPYAAFYGVLLFITGYVVGWLEGKARGK